MWPFRARCQVRGTGWLSVVDRNDFKTASKSWRRELNEFTYQKKSSKFSKSESHKSIMNNRQLANRSGKHTPNWNLWTGTHTHKQQSAAGQVSWQSSGTLDFKRMPAVNRGLWSADYDALWLHSGCETGRKCRLIDRQTGLQRQRFIFNEAGSRPRGALCVCSSSVQLWFRACIQLSLSLSPSQLAADEELWF